MCFKSDCRERFVECVFHGQEERSGDKWVGGSLIQTIPWFQILNACGMHFYAFIYFLYARKLFVSYFLQVDSSIVDIKKCH